MVSRVKIPFLVVRLQGARAGIDGVRAGPKNLLRNARALFTTFACMSTICVCEL